MKMVAAGWSETRESIKMVPLRKEGKKSQKKSQPLKKEKRWHPLVRVRQRESVKMVTVCQEDP